VGLRDFFRPLGEQNVGVRRNMMKGLIHGTKIAHSVINDRNDLRQLLTYFLFSLRPSKCAGLEAAFG
jgi:hypothetical protein